ncbi:MAG TPA: hypothetical protein VFY78_05680, partial [Gammaproteobacteria bacterium]|nr:hypothetical protein [Gammaproteobacteria bacterium]
MNISEVSQQLSSLLSKAGSLFLSATDDFASNLTVGQVIKGKVLRSYDSGRYLVDFNGQEKVVDSSVPLKTGELIQGRVIGIGEKVELKRMPLAADAKPEAHAPDIQARAFLGNKWDVMVRDAMLNYQVKLSAQDRDLISSLLKNSPVPERTLLAAIALMKQGLPASDLFMQLLGELQLKDRNLKLYPPSQQAP